MMWQIASRLTQKLPAEMAHNVAVKALHHGIAPKISLPKMPVTLAGIALDNPLGLAAGFDKNAEAYDGAFRLGFGFVEVGTITPLPQPGNARPRVFRLPEDEGVINRYGFNGQGMMAAARRLQARKKTGVVGVNIGANKLTKDKPSDYFKTAACLGALADYVTVNISSPNTPGLRDLQDAEGLRATLEACFAGLKQADASPPVFVKLAPDLTKNALMQSLEAALAYQVAGFILTNTTISRPEGLQGRHRHEVGGLSGAPVRALSEQTLSHAMSFQKAHGCQCDWISGGGIFSAKDVFLRLAMGAKATQLYSALSLKGVGLPAQIVRDLAKMQDILGADLADIIGSAKSRDEAKRQAEALLG